MPVVYLEYIMRGGKLTHGHSIKSQGQSPTYRSWVAMKTRCYNRKRENYARYGGSGITVCDRWLNSFMAFLIDMGVRPENTTLERKDNLKGYNPENCKWATTFEQAQNKRGIKLITFDGKSLCLTAWARETGINATSIKFRLDHGWTLEETLTFPSFRGNRLKNRLVFNGRNLTFAQWAKETQLSRTTIHSRLKSGWSTERALTTPVDTNSWSKAKRNLSILTQV